MTDLDFFFNPRSIAVLGASSKPGKIGYEVLKSIIDGGFEGDIYPVNIKGSEILGLKVQKSILDVPKDVDLAVFALPAEYTPKVMEECGKKGVSGAIIISGGFKELNGEGAELEKQTLDIARKYRIRVIGPNCVGVLSQESKFDTFFQPRYAMMRPDSGTIGILTQSGTFGLSILECLAQEKLGVSRFVSYGNKMDVDEIDMLRYLESDPKTKIIIMYVEALDYGREFTELAREIGGTKPIVMLKAGRTAKGKMAAKSHTGSLSGDDTVFQGAMRQCGVILVDDIDRTLDVVKVLALQPLPAGDRVAMVTNGVGPCIIATDELENTKHIEMAQLQDKTIDRLKEHLPDFCVFSNPLDVTGSATADWYEHSIKILKKDKDVDMIMSFFVFQDGPLAETVEELHEIMEEQNDLEKTLLCVATGGSYTKRQVAKLQEYGIPCIPTPKRAVYALGKVSWYARFLRELL